MINIHLVHGIHTKRGPKAFPAKLSPFFNQHGFATTEHYYGHIYAVQARWKNPRVLEELMDTVPDGCIYVGHSNGGTLAWLMAEAGKRFRGVVLINPALDENKVIKKAKFVHTYYNAGDKATSFARLLVWNPWGAMGKNGPSFKDPRYKNFNTGRFGGMPRVSGHSAIFSDKENLAAWGPLIADQVLNELTPRELESLGNA